MRWEPPARHHRAMDETGSSDVMAGATTSAAPPPPPPRGPTACPHPLGTGAEGRGDHPSPPEPPGPPGRLWVFTAAGHVLEAGKGPGTVPVVLEVREGEKSWRRP